MGLLYDINKSKFYYPPGKTDVKMLYEVSGLALVLHLKNDK